MADPVTQNRGLVIPNTGSSPGAWGPLINGDFAMLDTIVGGISPVSTSGGVTTLNAAQLACGTISVSGLLTSNAQLYFPAVQGWWSIENLTTGSFVLQICASGASATQLIAVPPGEITDIQINGTVAKFRNLGRVGEYVDVCDASTPAWITACTIPPYLNCDGTTFNATTYPFLNVKLGGNTLPDLRGVSRATLNQGTGRITAAGSGIDGNTRFSTGGGQSQMLTIAQIPSHQHNVYLKDPGHTHLYGYDGGSHVGGGGAFGWDSPLANTTSTGSSATGITIGSVNGTANDNQTATAGSGNAHAIMQPTTISGITLIRAA
jgi:hypothetical protein